MRDVYVRAFKYGGSWIYQVMVDGKVYDTMTLWTGPPLTQSQLIDVAQGYEEALDGVDAA